MKLLVIHVSGLHLGYLGCYGNDWISTPAIDRLAAEGVVFDQHFADCLGQWPTTWTGLYHYAWLADNSPVPSGLDEILATRDIPVFRISEAQLLAAQHTDPESCYGEIRQALGSALAGVIESHSWLIWLELPSLLPPWLVGEEFLLHYFQPGES